MAIQLPDARELADEVLEALRVRVLRGIELGLSETRLAEIFGLARETVCRWWTAYQAGGVDALPARTNRSADRFGTHARRFRRPRIQTKILDHCPGDWGIAAPLWTRRAVRDLIRKEFDIDMPIRTVGEYLKRWGYTPKKPRVVSVKLRT